MTHQPARGAEVVELELPARPEVVSVARLVIGALVATDPLFDDERGADLRLAISEACTNAIQAQMAQHGVVARNGYAGSVGEPILMLCTVQDGQIEVAVTDHGGGFDPNGLHVHPEVTDPSRLDYEGGFGIPLIKMLADSVEFRPNDGGTTVVMRFKPRTPGPRRTLTNRGPSGLG